MAEITHPLSDDTRHWQSELANYCRTGEATDMPGVSPDRLPHYRRLVYNIAYDTLRTAYPVTFRILSKEEWNGLVQRFFAVHPCQNYQVWKMPYELVVYLRENEFELKENYPYLEELVFFEWTEIEVYCEEDQPVEVYHESGDWRTDPVVCNPHHRLLTISYPFHQVKAEDAALQPGEYHLLILRDPDSGSAQFMALSPLFFQALEQLSATANHLGEALIRAGASFGVSDSDFLFEQSQPFIELLRSRKFLLGFPLKG
ncbi:putative DNA-binding domain-containing protein [bacterium SCSIO 12741]|nr:putative DNA-binding domain-containing protein [bacterium SCSIO 12741]